MTKYRIMDVVRVMWTVFYFSLQSYLWNRWS